MQLIVTLRKEVEDPEEGRRLVQIVQDKLSDHPEVKITAHVTNHYDLMESD